MIDSINNIFYIVIVIVAFVIGIVETISIANYQRKDCDTTKKAIAILQKYQGGYIKIDKTEKVDKTIIRWLTQYLKGESTPSAFKPEQSKSNEPIPLRFEIMIL